MIEYILFGDLASFSLLLLESHEFFSELAERLVFVDDLSGCIFLVEQQAGHLVEMVCSTLFAELSYLLNLH